MKQESKNQITWYFDKYIKECKYSKALRPATLKGYTDVFRNFCNTLPEVRTLQELSTSSFSVFFERLSIRLQGQGKELKGSTRYSYYIRLIMFIRWLEEHHYIGVISDRIASPPSPQYNDDRALNESEIAKIFTAIMLNNKNDPFLLKRDLMMFNILVYTGLRKSELLHLKVSDIDFSSQSINIQGATSKSKKTRRIPLHPNALYVIENYLEERKQIESEYLLLASKTYKELTEHGLVYWTLRYRKLSKVHFHLHRCRHTFACNLAKQGADIMTIKNLMGHTSIVMTERYLRSIGLKNGRDFINRMSFS